jgi:hypothetical protein
MMADMRQDVQMSGEQLLRIIRAQFITEKSPSVLSDIINTIVPETIELSIPLDHYLETQNKFFTLFLDRLAQGDITEQSTI